MTDLEGMQDPLVLPEIVTSEFILAAIRLVNIQNLAIQTMYAVGVDERIRKGMLEAAAARDYFGSAPNAEEMWAALGHHQEVYANLFRVVQEEMSH